MYLIFRGEAFSVNSPSVKCNYAPLGARQLSVKKTCIPMCFLHLWRVRYKTAVVLYLHPTLVWNCQYPVIPFQLCNCEGQFIDYE